MKQLNLKLITFTLLFGMLINPIFSQEIDEKPRSEFKTPGFQCEYKGDYIFCWYQNPDYTTIIDNLYFSLRNRETEKQLKIL